MVKWNRFDTDRKNERAIFARWISFKCPFALHINWKLLISASVFQQQKIFHGFANMGLKDGISCNILVAYWNLGTHIFPLSIDAHILLPIGPQKSLLMIIK